MCKASSGESYARAGNAANASLLAASLLYAGAVLRFTRPGSGGVLDDDWMEDGFCVHNKDVPFRSSFDACLYVDVVFSAVLGVLYWKWRALPGMEAASDIVPMTILGTLGHGLAHGAAAAKFRDRRYEEEKAQSDAQSISTQSFAETVLFCALFWFPLLKATIPKMKSTTVAAIAALAAFGPKLAGGMKKELDFAYIQTVISIAFHLSLLVLSAEEKQRREYMMLPLIAAIPVLVAWNEAFFCSAYLKSAGGHVWYDASIILSYIVFYVDCYRHHVLSSAKVESKQKTT